MDYILAPSILSADFKELGKENEEDRRRGSKVSAF